MISDSRSLGGGRGQAEDSERIGPSSRRRPCSRGWGLVTDRFVRRTARTSRDPPSKARVSDIPENHAQREPNGSRTVNDALSVDCLHHSATRMTKRLGNVVAVLRHAASFPSPSPWVSNSAPVGDTLLPQWRKGGPERAKRSVSIARPQRAPCPRDAPVANRGEPAGDAGWRCRTPGCVSAHREPKSARRAP